MEEEGRMVLEETLAMEEMPLQILDLVVVEVLDCQMQMVIE